MNLKQLPQAIKAHRKASGLSQAELAELAGVGKTVVFDVEHGKLTVRFDKLHAILSALNIKFQLESPIMKELQAEIEKPKGKKR